MKERLQLRGVWTMILMLICTMVIAQETGSIGGLITDQKSKEPITGATVQLEGTPLGTISDLDGKFILHNVPVGKYNVLIRYISYSPIQVKGLVVVRQKMATVSAEMVEDNIALEAVVVVAQARQNTDLSLLKATRSALVVASGVSSQQITRTQDRDASEVMRRIPGISIIDGKFVMIRGLAQRYNNVWINNGAVPSTEADSRAFSFDIIPSNQLDNMVIVKNPSPELPADFAGGFVKVQTKDIPSENAYNLSLGGSINTSTHFRTFNEAPGSPTDFLGFDNGTRTLPGNDINHRMNNLPEQIDRYSKTGFNNNWTLNRFAPASDLRLNGSLAQRYNLGEGRQFGLTAALNYTNAYTTLEDMKNNRFDLYNVREDQSDYTHQYTDNVYNHSVRLGGLVNLIYVHSPKARYELKNIVNQLAQNRYVNREGIEFGSSDYKQAQQEYLFNSRLTYNGQLSAYYEIERGKIDWNVGYAYANKNQPDRRIIKQNEDDFDGSPYRGQLRIFDSNVSREFTKLNDHIVSLSTNFTQEMTWGTLEPTLKAGLYGEYRARDYRVRRFLYAFESNNSNLPPDFAYGDITTDIFLPQNYGADRLYLIEEIRNTNLYDANNLNAAAYLGLNLPLGALNLYAGLRAEYNRMNLISYIVPNDYTTRSKLYPYFDLFPSLNMTYKLTTDQQLRLGYGSSVNRPEFREVSSLVYYDFDLFSDVKGNPNLKPAYIHNADIRYEYYPSSSEVVSAALFYKYFKNPIESIYINSSGSYTYSFDNADHANTYGIEVEVRKNLDFIGLKNFGLNFNGAYIISRVEFEKGSSEKPRPMQGQSPYLLNGGIFYQNDRIGLNVALLYNRIGERIVGVGKNSTTGEGLVNNTPDTYELSRNTLDLNISQRFAKNWEIRLSAKDLLAEKATFVQHPQFEDPNGQIQTRTQVVKEFKPGSTFYLSLSYSFK